MVKTQHDYNKEKMQQKALIDKIDNKKVAKKIDIYANNVIDTVVVNKDVKGYTPENVLTNLININKPKIDKDYEKVIKNKKTSDTLLHQVTVQRTANDKAVKISEEQYARLQKNIESVQKVLNKYEVNLDKYKELNKKYPQTVSRKGIITESISNKNYLTGTLGINIQPHFDGYKELTPLTEALHRQAQNEASKDLAEAQNEEAEANGEELPNTHKTWIWTGAGATTRHTSNDGQTIPIDEPFIIVNDVTGEVDEMMYPLDPNVTSSNGWICYCEVEYHNRGDDAKFELTPEMIQALDSAIEALNDKMPNDAYDSEISAGEPVDTSGLEVDAMLSEHIPSAHSELATELINQYSKLTNLEKLPMNATYKVLQEHYKLQSVEELGQLKSKLEVNKKPTVSDVVELVQKQLDTWEIIKPMEKTAQIAEIEKSLDFDTKWLKEEVSTVAGLKDAIKDVNGTFFQETYGKTFTKEEIPHLEKYVEDIDKTVNDYLKEFGKDYKDASFYKEAKEIIGNELNKLKGNLDNIKEQVKNNEKAETIIKETTETVKNAVETYDEMELQILHEQALKENEELHNKMQEKDKDAKPVDKINETKESVGEDPLQNDINTIIDFIDEAYNVLGQDFKTSGVVKAYLEFAKDDFIKLTKDNHFSESGKKQLNIIKDAFHDIKNKTVQKYGGNDAISEMVNNVENVYIKESKHFGEEIEVKTEPVKKEIDYSQDPNYEKIKEIEDYLKDIEKQFDKGAKFDDISLFKQEKTAYEFEELIKNAEKNNLSTNGKQKCLEIQEYSKTIYEKVKPEHSSIEMLGYLKDWESITSRYNIPIEQSFNKIIDNINENFSENVRVEIQNDIKSINERLVRIEEGREINSADVQHIERTIKDRIRDVYSREGKLTNEEIDYFIKLSNQSKKAVEENIKNNNYNKQDIKRLLNKKDMIPDERIIRKCKDLLKGENINFGYSTNYAQGKATVSYLKRFDSVKPSKKIIDKFNNKKPFTKNEIKHLTENIGEIRYLMELCDQAVIKGGGGDYNTAFRPVGYTKDAKALYGREPLDPKYDKYDDCIRTWKAGNDGEINKCRDMIDTEGEEKAKQKYGDRMVKFAKQIKEMNETVVPIAYTSYRGNRNSPHILDNLIGDSRGKTSYEAGMRYKISKDTCTSITEEGGDGFSGLHSDGTVGRVLITMLHPPKTNGAYLDNKCGFESETEIIKNRGAEMQLLLFDEETDTYLAWECYD